MHNYKSCSTHGDKNLNIINYLFSGTHVMSTSIKTKLNIKNNFQLLETGIVVITETILSSIQ